MKPKKPKPTKAQLQIKLADVTAQLIHNYFFADAAIGKAMLPRLHASAVILRLNFLGGEEVIPPVAIVDGLSPATVEAIRADLRRSFEYKTQMIPKGPREAGGQS